MEWKAKYFNEFFGLQLLQMLANNDIYLGLDIILGCIQVM